MHTSSTTIDHDAPHPGLQHLMLRELRGKSAASHFAAWGGRMATVALRRALLWSDDDGFDDGALAVAWARIWATRVSTSMPFPGDEGHVRHALSCALNEPASKIWAAHVTAMAKAEWSALRDDAVVAA